MERRTPGSRTKRPASGCALEPVSCRRTVDPGYLGTRSGRKEDITGTRGGSSREVDGTYERVHMYVHAGIRTRCLCVPREAIVLLLRGIGETGFIYGHV